MPAEIAEQVTDEITEQIMEQNVSTPATREPSGNTIRGVSVAAGNRPAARIAEPFCQAPPAEAFPSKASADNTGLVLRARALQAYRLRAGWV